MSATPIELVAVALFLICFFGFSILESAWLNKNEPIQFGRAFAFSFSTNTFGIAIGFFVSFVIFEVLRALYTDSSQKLWVDDVTAQAAVIATFLFPVILLVLAKRLMLKLFKMVSIESPWLYSIVAAIFFLLVVSAVPFLFVYFI